MDSISIKLAGYFSERIEIFAFVICELGIFDSQEFGFVPVSGSIWVLRYFRSMVLKLKFGSYFPSTFISSILGAFWNQKRAQIHARVIFTQFYITCVIELFTIHIFAMSS
jgi:hypothetical protein